MSILKVWQLTLILAKQDPLGGGWIEKRLFNPLLMRKYDFWHVQWFLNGQKWEVKKKHLSMSILKVWQLTLIWQNKMPWWEVGKKKGLFNPLLMRKQGFWHVQWFLNGQKWGVKKASLYVHFEGLTTDSYFGKTRCPGGRLDRKKAF